MLFWSSLAGLSVMKSAMMNTMEVSRAWTRFKSSKLRHEPLKNCTPYFSAQGSWHMALTSSETCEHMSTTSGVTPG